MEKAIFLALTSLSYPMGKKLNFEKPTFLF
jgi:hypothetical protein